MKINSFKLNISLLFVLLAGTVLAAAGFQFISELHRISFERVDRELETLATAEANRPLGPAFADKLASYLQARYGDEQTARFVIRVSDPDGRVIYESPLWPAGFSAHGLPVLPPPAEPEKRGGNRGPRGVRGSIGKAVSLRGPVFKTLNAGNESWRTVAVGNEHADFFVGVSLSGVDDDVRQARNAFFVELPLVLVLLFAAGWALAWRALRPVKAIAETAAGITALRLSDRIEPGGAAREFRQLIGVINAMLERLEASFQQASRFSADAAHELQTPLAVLQGQLEGAIQQAEPGSGEQCRCNDLLEETQRLKRIVQKLLLLSRADAGQLTLNAEPVNLSALMSSAAEDIELIAPQLQVQTMIQADVTVAADVTLLRQVIGNLTGNAAKYNQPNGLVRLVLEADGQTVRVTVSNTGPGIPAEDHTRVFERFYRADKSRARNVGGTGLGLSLAREIARVHGGDLVLDTSDESLVSFVLTLPRK
jgi:two-component system, OmpR family, heavy metal sensor histidine kinase CusS